ncbi:MAG: energy-coupling factor transporter transmembrane protein EcfT [Microbacteriaceae bacterium]|jgi:energy-coupling factor transport system permease protein|nr:energy-coupling factor transporter transmembrane protein EcfT [Microbacteriaceae bacterium]MCI1207124.1 energy-coupling factor transporter transmembrane protein EcfT [Microbacteriaceae bacterium]
MSISLQTRHGGPSSLSRFNPLALIVAALILSLTLLGSLDLVSASVSLCLVLVGLVVLRFGWRRFWRTTWPIWVAAPTVGITLLLYGQTSGRVYVHWLFVEISDGSIQVALSSVLRVIAMGIPAVLALAGSDLTALADALEQRARFPVRFVLGALAGLRLISLFWQDWKTLELARRARGLGDGGRIRRMFSQGFALLVLAIRRGTKLSVAMETRGLGAGPRTWARRSEFRARDWVLLGVAVLIASAAVLASILTGTWNPILGAG